MKMRTKKEIESKIDELYGLAVEGKYDMLRCIVTTDALSWVLGEDYLDNIEVFDEKIDNKAENGT